MFSTTDASEASWASPKPNMQWIGYISSVQIGEMFGMQKSLEDIITAIRLCWLGRVARMEYDHSSKKL